MTIQSELLIRKDPDPMLADPPPGWIRVEGDGAGGLSVVDENLAKTPLGSTTLAKMQTAFDAGTISEKDTFKASVSGAGVSALVSYTPQQRAQAIADVLASQGWVDLGRGTHTVAALPGQSGNVGAVRLSAGQAIYSTAPGATLKLADGQNCSLVVNADQTSGSHGVVIENITLDGNGSNQAATGIAATSEIDTSVANVMTVRCGRWTLRRVKSINSAGNGLFQNGMGNYQTCTDWDIQDCDFSSNALTGLQMSWATRRGIISNVRSHFNGRHGTMIDVSEMQVHGVKAVANGKDGVYIRNVYEDDVWNITAYLNGRHGIQAVAMCASHGGNWKSTWNGRNAAVMGAGHDVYFCGDGTAAGWGYGQTMSTTIDGIMCGPAVGSVDGSFLFSTGDNGSSGTARLEQWSLLVDSNITGSLRLLNVDAPAAGLAGDVSAPSNGSVVVQGVAGGTQNWRMSKGSMVLSSASTSAAGTAPSGVMRLGALRLWRGADGGLYLKDGSDPTTGTDGQKVTAA